MGMSTFSGLEFERIGEIEPERDKSGNYAELMPQSRFIHAGSTRLHAYGDGPFCRFRIARRRDEAGVFVLTVDGKPVLVGECENLERRWGLSGFGAISPGACFEGGQQTHCRVNTEILKTVQQGGKPELWFISLRGGADARREVRRVLIRELNTAWNLSG